MFKDESSQSQESFTYKFLTQPNYETKIFSEQDNQNSKGVALSKGQLQEEKTISKNAVGQKKIHFRITFIITGSEVMLTFNGLALNKPHSSFKSFRRPRHRPNLCTPIFNESLSHFTTQPLHETTKNLLCLRHTLEVMLL
ncbi:unnamed protein product [Pieris macdunnoughi]|uniref:Uncharacterized protein n=1 Tax=Pieris macdunnoughi TaxID=345717 RepID=A0A821V156_9NEOP|nr:unnamed protein product [Pieris macdunnoughi]